MGRACGGLHGQRNRFNDDLNDNGERPVFLTSSSVIGSFEVLDVCAFLRFSNDLLLHISTLLPSASASCSVFFFPQDRHIYCALKWKCVGGERHIDTD